MTKTIVRVKAATRVWKMGLPPRGKSGRDAHHDPHPGPADGTHRGEGPRCIPVCPRQPPADAGTLRGRTWLGHRISPQLRLPAADCWAFGTLRLTACVCLLAAMALRSDRKSTRLNSSH